MAGPYWFGVVLETLPDSFTHGMIVSEGLADDEPNDASQFQYAILAIAAALSANEAEGLIRNAAAAYSPSAVTMIADTAKQVVRHERLAAASLSLGDVVLKNSFVGFKRDCPAARNSAVQILELATRKQWWQFWR